VLPNLHTPPQMPHNGYNFTADHEEESIIFTTHRTLLPTSAEAFERLSDDAKANYLTSRGERTPRGRVSDDQGAKSPDANDAVHHVPFTHIVTQISGAGTPMDLRGTSEVCTNAYIYVPTSTNQIQKRRTLVVYMCIKTMSVWCNHSVK